MRQLLAAIAALCLIVCAYPVHAADLAATPATFASVFKSAPCGARIVVAGTVGKARPGTKLCTAANPLNLISDPANPGVFKGGLTADGWQGVTLTGLTCDIGDATAEYATCVLVNGGRDLTFDKMKFTGRVTDTGDKWGYGLRAAGTTNLKVTSSSFADLARGVMVSLDTGSEITDNGFDRMGSDGVDFGSSTDLLIARNYFGDFAWANGAHPDDIQGMCVGTMPDGAPSRNRDITIRDNLSIKAPAKGAQFIFPGCETGQSYKGSTVITGNVGINSAYNGIRGGPFDALTLTDNYLPFQQAKDATGKVIAPNQSWIMLGAGTKGTATNNRAMSLTIPPEVVQSGNAVIPPVTQDQVDKAVAAWKAKFSGPAPDPRDKQIADLTAKVASLSAELSASKATAAALNDQLAIEQTAAAQAQAERDAARNGFAAAQAKAAEIVAIAQP